ncbi:MAG: hypothetical protein RLN96_01180 [Pseudomonadales bacterium]
MQDYIASTDALKEDVARTYDRLQRHGKVPDEARVTVLNKAEFKYVATFQKEFFDESEEASMYRLTDGCQGFCFDINHSFVVWNGEDFAGYLLTLEEASAIRRFVYSVVILPPYRGGWANVLLKYTAADELLKAGFTELGFRADHSKTDARNHSRRTDAKLVDYH